MCLYIHFLHAKINIIYCNGNREPMFLVQILNINIYFTTIQCIIYILHNLLMSIAPTKLIQFSQSNYQPINNIIKKKKKLIFLLIVLDSRVMLSKLTFHLFIGFCFRFCFVTFFFFSSLYQKQIDVDQTLEIRH